MEFRIADTFTDSLARLTGEEQKLVKMTAFDLQMDPASPGMKFHRLDKARDKNFWSLRVSSDLRLIVHKTGDGLLLCYVSHHDPAYHWAERRKLETHPATGAAQLVEIRETVREIEVPKYVEVERPAPRKPPLFAKRSDEELLGYGVPEEWLADVRAADEDSLLDLSDHLPAEAAEALLNLAVGVKPQPAQTAPAGASPFEHPDALRRFRVMTNVEELERALEFPWDKWTIFLHPSQRQLVERDYAGPARVSGSAGTGKTIVALHRAVFLARANEESRVLLTTFSDTLASALRTKLRRLVSNEPRLGERLEAQSVEAIAARLYERHFGPARLVGREELAEIIGAASAKAGSHKLSRSFLVNEWELIVDAWQLATWEEYRDVARLGRKTRLPENARRVLWSIFEYVREELGSRGLITPAGMYMRLAEQLASAKHPTFDYVVVDESQDVSVPQLRFLSALGAARPNSLFFVGDLGQRIFQQAFSWKSLGVDVRGRSRTLKVNYRTSHQIRSQADRLLGAEVADVDGDTQDRRGTVSVFNGPKPEIEVFDSPEEEIVAVAAWLAARRAEGVESHEIGIFVRSEAQLERARVAMERSGIPFKVLDEKVETTSLFASVSTMHLAKGLEFRAVAVMACDDEALPLQERIEAVTDDSDLEEVYDTERHLLYVACTRARDYLLVTSGGAPSEFLDDIRG